jgi:hypothetical protein
VLACLGLGCQANPMTPVQLEAIVYEHRIQQIAGTVEVCLPPSLRLRRWDVRGHRYSVDLGDRAALNLERLAKAAFRDVVVSFDEACGSSSDLTWMTARIVSANRDLQANREGNRNTSITMEFELVGDDGQPIWSSTTKGEVLNGGNNIFFFRMFFQKRDGASDFGEALRIALELGFDELVESDAVRRSFGDESLNPPPTLEPMLPADAAG